MRGEAEFCSENKNRFILKREWSKSKNSVSDVVYAWGNDTDEPNFLKQIVDSPMCLGKNKDGSPSHPLYLPSNSKLLKFR